MGRLSGGVCRRILRNHHDAEDAFEATFLVLIRRAASIASRDLLANWLYGVARQTALKARAAAVKRGRRERQCADAPEPAAATHDPGDDLPAVLDQELNRLPEKYRGVILLCDLGGMTRREAAERLGVPEGTVGSRQVRGRAMLAKRLARRGASPPAVVSPAAVPAKLLLSTARAATAGKSVPATVTALAEGVIKAMHFTKVVCVGTLLLAMAVVAGGAALLAGPAFQAGPPAPQEPKAVALGNTTAKDAGERTGDVKKEDETAWGEAVGGLQAGIAFKGGRRAYRIGEVVPLVVRLRNVTDKAIAFDYFAAFFIENPPTVTDAAGKPAMLSGFNPIPDGVLRERHLSPAAGETVEFGSLDLALAPADAQDDSGKPTLFASPGVYRVRYEVLPPLWENNTPKVKGLSTGALDLEVKKADPPAGAKGDLEGAWQAVSFEQDGRTPRDVNVKEVAATFEGDKYHLTTGMRVQGAGKGTLAVHPDTDPKTFELTPDSGVFEGQAFRGVYRLDGDKLTLCFSWPVKDRPTEFASPPNSTVVLAVFERRKP